MNIRKHLAAGLAASLLATASASANVYITEFSSDAGNNTHYEFVEFTNCGTTPVNMNGWSEDDSHAKAGTHSLSGLGILQPGESGILTEATPTDFINFWGAPLTSAVPIVGPYTNDNLSTTSDSITLFNASNTLVDRLDYSGTGTTGDMVGRNCPLNALGLNENSLWVNSFIGDSYGSWFAAGSTANVANPGQYIILPEPASIGFLGFTALLLARKPRRQ
jgi:hypothetical protein